MSSVEWNHEKCLLLISKFRTYEALWNSNSKSFHSPKMKEDAWWALAKDIGSQVAEVKRKMECLRGSYRRERSRVRGSLEQGRKYVPKWFAYNSLSFLDETRPHDVTGISVMGVNCDVSTPSMKKSGCLDTFDYILSDTKHGISSNGNHGNESFKPVGKTEPENENPHSFNTSIPISSTSCEQQPKDDVKLSIKQEDDASDMEDTEFIDKKVVLPHGKFKIFPRRRRFCSKGPYKPIRMKPKLKKRKVAQDSKSVESTAREPLVSSNERSSKCGSGWMEKFGEETSQSLVNEVEESGESSSKTQSTSRNLEGLKSCKENDSILLGSSKLSQRHDETHSDECSVFGQLVENSLRQLTAVQRVKAKTKLSNVLWEVEMDALNGDT